MRDEQIESAIDKEIEIVHQRAHGIFVRREWLEDPLSGWEIHFINPSQRPFGMPIEADGQSRGNTSTTYIVFDTDDMPLDETALCHEMLHVWLFSININNHHGYRDFFKQSGSWSIEEQCISEQIEN